MRHGLWSVVPGLLGLALLFQSTGCGGDRPIHYRINPSFTVADPEFRQTMGNLLGPPLVPGNACETLVNGDQIFPAMLNAIHSAQKTITFETYVYWSGTVGQQFSDAFCERARAGVSINVLIDWFGGSRISGRYTKAMKQAGVHLYEYHAFHFYDINSYRLINYRTHRKLLVVDGNVGFTGGVGIADQWGGNAESPAHWRDNYYRVTGPVVAQLQAAFADNWMQSTGIVLDGRDYFPPLPPTGDLIAQVFKSSAMGGSDSMQLMILLSIASAGKSICLESAYFVPDDLTERYVIDARRRGVRVDIVIPGPHIDKQFVRGASRAHWGKLLKAGVNIYEFQPTMLHAKLLIVDGLWVSIGSSNLDGRSFRINDEANLNVLNAPFAERQIQLFEADKQRSRKISLKEWEDRPFFEKVKDGIEGLFSIEL